MLHPLTCQVFASFFQTDSTDAVPLPVLCNKPSVASGEQIHDRTGTGSSAVHELHSLCLSFIPQCHCVTSARTQSSASTYYAAFQSEIIYCFFFIANLMLSLVSSWRVTALPRCQLTRQWPPEIVSSIEMDCLLHFSVLSKNFNFIYVSPEAFLTSQQLLHFNKHQSALQTAHHAIILAFTNKMGFRIIITN